MGGTFTHIGVVATPHNSGGDTPAGTGQARARMSRLQSFLALALTLGVCALVPASAAASTGGTISGTVTAATGKAPIDGIKVCVVSATVEYSSASCGFTNSSGEYAVSGLASGSYKVAFENEVCNPLCSAADYIPQYWKNAATWATATTVPVTNGATASGIDAELVTGGTIEGTVTSALSKAVIAGLQVCAFQAGAESEYHCAYADGQGEYKIVGLPSGSYDVDFENFDCTGAEGECKTLNYISQYWEDASSSQQAKAVTVTAPGTVKAIDAALKTGGEIEGTVTAASGSTPIEGIEVCATPQHEGTSSGACAQTNQYGKYTVLGLEAGKYVVSFAGGSQCGESGCSAPNYVGQYYQDASTLAAATPITAEENVVKREINASMTTGGQIHGTVTTAPNGAPIQGITVCAEPSGGSGSEWGDCSRTQANGEYALVGLSGSYKLAFYGESACLEFECRETPYLTEYYNRKFAYQEAEVISVTPPQSRGGFDARLFESVKQAEEEAAAAKKHEEEAAAAAKKHEEETAAAAKRHEEEAAAAAKRHGEETAAAAKKQEEEAAARKHAEASASIKVVVVKVTASSALVTVKLTSAGTVTVTGRGLKKTSVAVELGTHTVKVPLTSVGKSERKHGSRVKIAVSVRVGGRTVSASKEVKL